MNDTYITIVGNVVDEPRLRTTSSSGVPVLSFRVASTSRRLDRETGKWQDSDRLFASWELKSPRVEALADGRDVSAGTPEEVIEIPNDFGALLKSDASVARAEALRIRKEFLRAFSAGLECRAFERDDKRPKYLLYKEEK